MKLTSQRLKRLIKEELEAVIDEKKGKKRKTKGYCESQVEQECQRIARAYAR